MRARCPNNEDHHLFDTTVAVSQIWLVDQTGELSVVLDDCAQMIAGPDPGNAWNCADCGAPATFDPSNDTS